MSGLFDRLANRTTAADGRVAPRVAARFESSPFDVGDRSNDVEGEGADLVDGRVPVGERVETRAPEADLVEVDIEVGAHAVAGNRTTPTDGTGPAAQIDSAADRTAAAETEAPPAPTLTTSATARGRSASSTTPSESALDDASRQTGPPPSLEVSPSSRHVDPGSRPAAETEEPSLGLAPPARTDLPAPSPATGDSHGGSHREPPTLAVGSADRSGDRIISGDRRSTATAAGPTDWSVEPAGIDVTAVEVASPSTEAASSPTIEVTIGRIQVVTASAPPAPVQRRSRRAAPRIELDAYLGGRR